MRPDARYPRGHSIQSMERRTEVNAAGTPRPDRGPSVFLGVCGGTFVAAGLLGIRASRFTTNLSKDA